MADDTNNPPQINGPQPNLQSLPNLGPTPQQQLSGMPQMAQDSPEAALNTSDQYWQQQLKENTPAPIAGGPVKRLLTNFFSGMGNSMMKQAGLPTQQDLQQRALTGIQNNAIARGNLSLHQMMASQMGTTPIQMPDGSTINVANKDLGKVYQAQTAAQSKIGSAQIGAQAKLSTAQMQIMAASGQLSRLIPATNENGETVMRAINKYGQPIGDIEGAIPPQSYLGKTSTTQEWKQLEDGSYVALPKTTTTRPNIPGMPGSAPTGGGTGVSTKGGIATMGGQPIIGKGAITSSTKTMVETAPKVEDLANRLLGHIDTLEQSGDLGPGMSRWNDFWSGKVGTENPEFRRMMTDSNLLSTLLMRMHMGARGSTQIMQHFNDILGAGRQSPANMRAAIGEILQYTKDVKGASPLPAGYGSFNKPVAPTSGFAAWKASQNAPR